MEHHQDDGRDESPAERADRNWGDILQELRATQAGTQIMSGFLLAIAFQPAFADLPLPERILYLCLVALAGVATLLGILPVIYHRRMFQKKNKHRVVRVGNTVVSVLVGIVGLLAAGVVGLIFTVALNRTAGAIAIAVALVVVGAIWTTIRVHTAHEVGPDDAPRAAPPGSR